MRVLKRKIEKVIKKDTCPTLDLANNIDQMLKKNKIEGIIEYKGDDLDCYLDCRSLSSKIKDLFKNNKTEPIKICKIEHKHSMDRGEKYLITPYLKDVFKKGWFISEKPTEKFYDFVPTYVYNLYKSVLIKIKENPVID